MNSRPCAAASRRLLAYSALKNLSWPLLVAALMVVSIWFIAASARANMVACGVSPIDSRLAAPRIAISASATVTESLGPTFSARRRSLPTARIHDLLAGAHVVCPPAARQERRIEALAPARPRGRQCTA